MQTIIKAYIVLLFLFVSTAIFGNDSMQNEVAPSLKLDRDGIRVYIYSHKNSDIAAFKAVTHIKAPLDSVLAVMFDSKACTEWVHACEKSFVIEDISFNERYHYQISNIPFPFKNRDFIFHSIMRQNRATGAVNIAISSAPRYCDNKQSDACHEVKRSQLVRVSKSIGNYTLVPDKNGTKITWTQHTNPSGNLPGWLVNQFVQDMPYWTLKNLAKKVKEEKYQSARLVYNVEGQAIALSTTAGKQMKSKMAQNFTIYPSF